MKYTRDAMKTLLHPFRSTGAFHILRETWFDWSGPLQVQSWVNFTYVQHPASELIYKIRVKGFQVLVKGFVPLSYDEYLASLRRKDPWTEEIFKALENKIDEEIGILKKAREDMLALGFEEGELPSHLEDEKDERFWGFLRTASPNFQPETGAPIFHYEVGYFQKLYADGAPESSAVLYKMVDRAKDDWYLGNFETLKKGLPFRQQVMEFERKPLKELIDKDSKHRISWTSYLASMPEPLRMEIVETNDAG